MDIIFVKFFNLEPEKQERILNAALNEFAHKGFKNASTNEIVKEASIGKGMLFHYFNNKKDLFIFLYDYCIDINMNEFYKRINLDEKDFFVRLRQIQLIKMELLNKYPDIFKFLQVAYIEKSSDIKDDLDNSNKKYLESASNKVFEGIDMSKFKDGIDIKKVINIITWTLQGFADGLLNKAKLTSSNQINYEKAFSETEDYLEIFKNCFYK